MHMQLVFARPKLYFFSSLCSFLRFNFLPTYADSEILYEKRGVQQILMYILPCFLSHSMFILYKYLNHSSILFPKICTFCSSCMHTTLFSVQNYSFFSDPSPASPSIFFIVLSSRFCSSSRSKASFWSSCMRIISVCS